MKLAGSRIFGTPKEDSDLDAIVFVTAAEAVLLGQLADEPRVQRPGTKSYPVRFGKLNLIVCTDYPTYLKWLGGCKILEANKPVTKDQACKVFESLGVS